MEATTALKSSTPSIFWPRILRITSPTANPADSAISATANTSTPASMPSSRVTLGEIAPTVNPNASSWVLEPRPCLCNCGFSGNSPMVTASLTFLPSRITTTLDASPTGARPTNCGNSLARAISSPLNSRIMSSSSKPPFSAGLSFNTRVTNAPLGRSSPKPSAKSLVNSRISTPSHPRETRPLSLSCSTTSMAMSIGIAKLTPIKPPELE